MSSARSIQIHTFERGLIKIHVNIILHIILGRSANREIIRGL